MKIRFLGLISAWKLLKREDDILGTQLSNPKVTKDDYLLGGDTLLVLSSWRICNGLDVSDLHLVEITHLPEFSLHNGSLQFS